MLKYKKFHHPLDVDFTNLEKIHSKIAQYSICNKLPKIVSDLLLVSWNLRAKVCMSFYSFALFLIFGSYTRAKLATTTGLNLFKK